MIFMMRVGVATLLILAALLTDLPERLARQWAVMGDARLEILPPILEVWAVPAERSATLAFDASPGSDVRLITASGVTVPSQPAGSRIDFFVDPFVGEEAVVSWKPHAFDGSVELTIPEHGSWSGVRPAQVQGGRAQLPVIIGKNDNGTFALRQRREAPRRLEKSSVSDPTRHGAR